MSAISKYAKLTPEIQRALIDARDLAMHQTMAARIPECGDFGAIAQSLDYVVGELNLSYGVNDVKEESSNSKGPAK